MIDGIEKVESERKKTKDDAERAQRLAQKVKRAEQREALNNKIRGEHTF